MLSKDVRKKFLEYFKSQSHRIVPSSPVIPHDDPTILFTNAGMNQFKDVFLGTSKRDYTKAASAQKCIRVGGKHNDLENVGHTSRHLTFFEMLGNFSFGDYFKEKAIAFAFDVATNIFSFDPKKIWVSVYKDDDETFALWEKYIPSSRIVRFGKEENFWSMGETGPCGPCSELLYDRGEKYSDAISPIYDISGERYLEFWNLVFMQFNTKEDGSIQPLPKPCVDTGAGLERILSLMINVDSVFLTDIFQNIIKTIEEISFIKYDPNNKETTPAFHVIADHIRSLAFAISDGVHPGNSERGYVLRKILRRSLRYARKLHIKKPFLKDILNPLIDSMGEDYPSLISNKDNIAQIITLEEEKFIRTLKKGGNLLTDVIQKSSKIISGEDAFKLKDTYGFPIEEILLIAKDAHLTVDLKKFNHLEEEAKKRSKKAHITKKQFFSKSIFEDFSKTHAPTSFFYEKTSMETRIIGILKENTFVSEITEKDAAILLLEKTPFYAEKGGQASDKGKIFFGNNVFIVTDCQNPYPGIYTHIGYMEKGSFQKNQKVSALIDPKRRESICQNHTATHLLHWALGKVLGEHIIQSGSFIDDKKLRFDFAHPKALSFSEIKQIEKLINQKIRENKKIFIQELSLEKAQKDPSIKKIFGEKYSKTVRLVDIEFSKELCGGCHVNMLGSIGIFKITEEKSIAAGIRRIEAVTGDQAEEYIWEKQDFIFYLENLLKTPKPKIPETLESLLKNNKTLLKILKKEKKEKLSSLKETLLQKKEKIGNFSLITATIDLDPKELPSFTKQLSCNLPSTIIALASLKEKPHIVITCSNDVVSQGILADTLIKDISPIIDGCGGGSVKFAQAGGSKGENIQKVFEKIRSIIKSKC